MAILTLNLVQSNGRKRLQHGSWLLLLFVVIP